MRLPLSKAAAAGLLLLASDAQAIQLLNSTSSTLSSSKTIVNNILQIYNANGSSPTFPGLFPAPYYFWESGLAWDSLINYWSLSGDESVVSTVRDGITFQIGQNQDFMPVNQTASEGNDDQSFWALAAMTAAELGFPQPMSKNVSWVQLAQNVFNEQAARWSRETCNGGLRWQIFPFNAGYNYKNSLTNGNFFQLATRLARYTGNETYTAWAQTVLDWSYDVGLLNSDGAVYDGTDVTSNCSQISRFEFSGSAGTYLTGLSYISNATHESERWNPFAILVHAQSVFTTNTSNNGILYESACAPIKTCNLDQLAQRAILARALGRTRDLTYSSNLTRGGQPAGTSDSRIDFILQASAQGAAAQCSGGSDGTTCGNDWSSSEWDGTLGLGQELSALEVILATLPGKELRTMNSTGPVVNATQTGGSVNGTTTTPASSPSASPPMGAASALQAFTMFTVGTVFTTGMLLFM